MDVFGELRSRLGAPASPGAWADLCRLMEQVEPARFVDEVAPYLEGRLQAWPDALRRVPRRWMERDEEEAPWLGQCRALCLRLQMFRQDPCDAAARVLRAPWMSNITELAVHNLLDARHEAMHAALWHNERLAGVTRLALVRRPNTGSVFATEEGATEELEAIEASPLAQELRALRLEQVLASYPRQDIGDLLFEWLRSPALAGLEALNVEDSGDVLGQVPLEELELERLHTLRWYVSRGTKQHPNARPRPGWLPALRHIAWAGGQENQGRWCAVIAGHDQSSIAVRYPAPRSSYDPHITQEAFERMLEAIGEDNTLRSLRLSGLDASCLPDLAAFAGWRTLETLHLGRTSLKAREHRGFFGELEAPNLRHLELEEVEMTHHGVLGLERFERLETLDIREKAKLEEKGAQALATHPGRWERLSVHRTMLRAAGAQALLAAPALAGVRRLDLTGNKIEAEGVRALVESPHLEDLEVLHLGTNHTSNELGAEALAMLATWPSLTKLKVLNLGCAKLTWEALLPLLAAEMPALEVLDLTLNDVGAEGLEVLCENASLQGLRALGLTATKLDPGALAPLLRSSWPRLQALTFHDNQLKTKEHDRMLPWLTGLPSLEVVDGGSPFLKFIGRRKSVAIDFEVTTRLSYRGLTDRELAPEHVFTTVSMHGRR